MKYRIMGVHLRTNQLISVSESDFTETGFVSPEHVGEGIYSWEVLIHSKLNSKKVGGRLFVETISEYQFSAGSAFADEFNQGVYFEPLIELIFAAHCHHAALFYTCALKYPGYEDLIPKVVSLEEVRVETEKAMRNARPL
jgi:hypothetical protein